MEENIHQREKIRRPPQRVEKTIEVDYREERPKRIIRKIELIPDESKPAQIEQKEINVQIETLMKRKATYAASTSTQKTKNRKARSTLNPC